MFRLLVGPAGIGKPSQATCIRKRNVHLQTISTPVVLQRGEANRPEASGLDWLHISISLIFSLTYHRELR